MKLFLGAYLEVEVWGGKGRAVLKVRGEEECARTVALKGGKSCDGFYTVYL
jgi:hypothetical protein